MSVEKQPVFCRGLALGTGLPKVIVSVMGADTAQIRESALRAAKSGAQMLELRIDALSPMPDEAQAIEALCAVRRAAPQLPLLFTLRTARDGGAGSADAQAYEALLCDVAHAKACDAIDVELSVGEDAFSRIVCAAHMNGLLVVGSSHEFGEIGEAERAGAWLLEQERLGADICKAAVMPRDTEQALELMLSMMRAGKQLSAPYAAIVMGESGVMSRVCAQAIGSCMTFGAAGRASAPGQIAASALLDILREIGGAGA